MKKSILFNNDQYKIESPEGFVGFIGVNKITKNDFLRLKFTDGSELSCSEDHPLSTIEGIVRAKDLDKNTEVHTKTGGCFLVSRKKIRKKIDLYDIVDSGTQNLYYSNGLVSHNCEFLGSSNTLISGDKLKVLTWKNPIRTENDDLKIYEEVKDGHVYALMVDVAHGQNLDYSAFSVIDVTMQPYLQVATYRSNKIQPLMYPNIIYSVGKYYNDAHVLVEINDIGQQVADILHFELEYDNLVKVEAKQKQGQKITGGFVKRTQFGLKSSTQTKRIGCANLKTMIESDKLILQDETTITELFTFSAQKDSFMADEGAHDDMVMGLVFFGWFMSQKFIRDGLPNDVRKSLAHEQHNFIEDENFTALIIDDGLSEEEEEEAMKGWETVRMEKDPFGSWGDWDWTDKSGI